MKINFVQIAKMKYMYLAEVNRKLNASESDIVKSVIVKKCGRPLLLGEKLDSKVKVLYSSGVRGKGCSHNVHYNSSLYEYCP